MAEPHVVTGLMQKRAEIAGRIEHTQIALRLFVPDIDLEEIKPKPFPPRNSAVRGELSRIVLSPSAVRKAAHDAGYRPARHG